MFTRIYTDITAETLDDEIFLIEADGGTFTREDHNGAITLIAEYPGDPPPAVLPTTVPEFPWMAIAQAEIGVTEGGNPRITEYFKTTSLGEKDRLGAVVLGIRKFLCDEEWYKRH